MTFMYAGSTYTLPDNLSGISLVQQQAWSAMYGYQLALAGVAGDQVSNPLTQKLNRQLQFMDEITQALSFYSGIPLATVRSGMDVGQIVRLIGDSQIALAIQGQHMAIEQSVFTVIPSTVTIMGQVYNVNTPHGSVGEAMSHTEFLISLLLARYLLELEEGDWSNYHLLLAGYVRLPGEAMSMDNITSGSARSELFRNNITMQDGAPLAQYFVGQTGGLITVLDKYTGQQLLT